MCLCFRFNFWCNSLRSIFYLVERLCFRGFVFWLGLIIVFYLYKQLLLHWLHPRLKLFCNILLTGIYCWLPHKFLPYQWVSKHHSEICQVQFDRLQGQPKVDQVWLEIKIIGILNKVVDGLFRYPLTKWHISSWLFTK